MESKEKPTKKTAEEILREYATFGDVNGSKTIAMLPLTIVDCMEEYASQRPEKAVMEFKDLLNNELPAIQNIMYRSVNGEDEEHLLDVSDEGCKEIINYLIEKLK